MRELATAGALLLALAPAQQAGSDASSARQRWTFDQDPVDAPPAGFTFARTGAGSMGRWLVRTLPAGEKVLVQADEDPTRDRYPIAVADAPVLRDLELSVRCKPLTGKVDQACGLVFRYRDENNYYVTRANALEGNIRLYYVKGGYRQQLASWSGDVPAGRWHELRAEAQGDHLAVFWNGQKVIAARDTTFPQPGKVGLWTKADSVTAFDDLAVAAPERPAGGVP